MIKVFQVRDLHDKQEYAIKKIRLRHRDWIEGGCATKAALQAVLDEVQYHASLDHRNISRYLHCWFESPLDQPRLVRFLKSVTGAEYIGLVMTLIPWHWHSVADMPCWKIRKY